MPGGRAARGGGVRGRRAAEQQGRTGVLWMWMRGRAACGARASCLVGPPPSAAPGCRAERNRPWGPCAEGQLHADPPRGCAPPLPRPGGPVARHTTATHHCACARGSVLSCRGGAQVPSAGGGAVGLRWGRRAREWPRNAGHVRPRSSAIRSAIRGGQPRRAIPVRRVPGEPRRGRVNGVLTCGRRGVVWCGAARVSCGPWARACVRLRGVGRAGGRALPRAPACSGRPRADRAYCRGLAVGRERIIRRADDLGVIAVEDGVDEVEALSSKARVGERARSTPCTW